MDENLKSKLKYRDWFLMITLSTIMVVVSGLSYIKSRSTPTLEEGVEISVFNEPMLEISVSGAVLHPGVYSCKKGALLQEILDLAKLRPDANIDKINLSQRVRKNKNIYIPFDHENSENKKIKRK